MKSILVTLAFVSLIAMPAIAFEDATHPGTPTATDEMFDELFSFPLENNYCVGVGWDGQYLWVSAGDGTTGTPEFYIYDEYGTLVDGPIHQGGGASGWGNRDLAFDGTYVFGSFGTPINGFEDVNTYSGSFNGPLNPNRAMAFDGTYFYTGGFGEYLYRVDWNGNWGSTATSTILSGPYDGTYGLAYDSGNDCLWMTTANYTGDVLQLDMSGNQIGTYSTLFSGYDLHGGCTMADTRFGHVLVILMQSDVDTIVFYDVESTPSPADETTWGGVKALFR